MTVHDTAPVTERFVCFGARCTVSVLGDGGRGTAKEAVRAIRHTLLGWHERFTRFNPQSELMRLNADPREEVPVSAVMTRFVAAALEAAEAGGGLVDPTLLPDLAAAGYARDRSTAPTVPLADLLAASPPRHPAVPRAAVSPRHPATASPQHQAPADAAAQSHHDAPPAAAPAHDAAATWRNITVDVAGRLVRRPPGLAIDSGSLAKGFFADLLSASLRSHAGYAIDCDGDIRCAGSTRDIHVRSPFEGTVLHVLVDPRRDRHERHRPPQLA